MSSSLAAEVNTSDITREVISRTTKGGRRLHYELTCLQQPERARACGSGQKCKSLVFSELCSSCNLTFPTLT